MASVLLPIFSEPGTNAFVRPNVMDMIPYPDVVLQSDMNLNVTGKKKSKL